MKAYRLLEYCRLFHPEKWGIMCEIIMGYALFIDSHEMADQVLVSMDKERKIAKEQSNGHID